MNTFFKFISDNIIWIASGIGVSFISILVNIFTNFIYDRFKKKHKSNAVKITFDDSSGKKQEIELSCSETSQDIDALVNIIKKQIKK